MIFHTQWLLIVQLLALFAYITDLNELQLQSSPEIARKIVIIETEDVGALSH